MKLQTMVPLSRGSDPIDYKSNILLLGSCFAEHIAAKLDYFQFNSLSNPFGILFNPVSIGNLAERASAMDLYSESELVYLNEAWHCLDAHSELSRTSAPATLKDLNEGLAKMQKGMKEASHIIVTLGTAWVYRYKETSRFVANCHKIPQKEFEKELLSIQAIQEELGRLVELIRAINPNTVLIFTVSPVRHLRDGFTENMRSKAHLISALHDVVDGDFSRYFPSFELMMDELRDYRFYGRDLIHPNELAIDYIWEKFKESWIDPGTYEVMGKVHRIRKGLEHRPFDPDSEQYNNFKSELDSKIRKLQKSYPHMNF